MPQKEYKGGVAATALTSDIGTGTTSIIVDDGSGLPTAGTYPFVIVVDRDTVSEELMFVTARATNTLTVTRAYDNTTAVVHSAGAVVEHCIDAGIVNEASAHIYDTTDAHAASAITNTPAGNIAATTVQAALNELDSEKVHKTGNETIAGIKTFSSAPVVPADAYASGWNGKQEPAPKDAVYDKIEAILAGATFTGDIVVPAEAYGVGWDGSNEAPTKNDVYDKIQSLPTALVSSVVKSANESVTSSTTLQDDDELTLAVAASTDYGFEAWLPVSSNSTADFKMTFTVPSGASISWAATIIGVDGSAQTFSSPTFPITASGTALVWDMTAITSGIIIVRGSVRNSTTAGSLTLQFAQNTSNAVNTTVKAGSTLKLVKEG